MSHNEKKSPKEKKRQADEKFEEGQEFVDDIPLEDLKIEMKDERKKTKTKDDSQSERKFKGKDN